MDLCLNGVIFLTTAVITVRYFRRDKVWALKNGAVAFRYFTVLSNVLCAVAAACMCLAPARLWAWTLKYVGTVAVTVTMLTVFVFLGPNMGYKKLLSGPDLYMHLIAPVLAIVSFLLLEKRGMRFAVAMLGVLPVLLYGLLYLHKVLRAPEGQRWEDFYGFNKGGKWRLSFALMLLGSFALSMVFMVLQNG